MSDAAVPYPPPGDESNTSVRHSGDDAAAPEMTINTLGTVRLAQQKTEQQCDGHGPCASGAGPPC